MNGHKDHKTIRETMQWGTQKVQVHKADGTVITEYQSDVELWFCTDCMIHFLVLLSPNMMDYNYEA